MNGARGWEMMRSRVSFRDDVSVLELYTVDPWTTWVWTAWVHLYMYFFPINTDSTCLLHVLRLGREGKGRKGKRILHDLRLLVKSMDVELQIRRGDCGTWASQLLVSAAGLGINPPWTSRAILVGMFAQFHECSKNHWNRTSLVVQ